MNFLALCQRTVRESGTISGDSTPSTVVGKTGRERKFIDWVSSAYTEIQNTFDDWKWLRDDYSSTISAGTSKYTAASFNLSRHSRWITSDGNVTMYLTATGVSDEGELTYIEWEDWRRLYDRGTQTQGRPVHYAISPADEICFGPVPDAGYTVRGEYQKSAQILAADADIPEMPSDYHLLIVWDALLLAASFDEGGVSMQEAQRKRLDVFRALCNKQRPNPTFTGSLA